MAAMSTFEQLQQHLIKNQYTWLITGVAGFIGSNLLETLLKLNQKVIGFDNFVTGYKDNIDDVLNHMNQTQKNNFDFIEGDICDLAVCKQAIKGAQIVLHQAALGSVPRSIVLPEVTNQTNVTGFLHMLVAAKEAKVKRFVYASSSSVYGDSPTLPKVESDIGNPLSPYAVSKYTNELYSEVFSLCYGMETIGLRYFNVFGPRQDPTGPYAAVIPLWILSLLKNQPVYINGDGETSRDFCYIDNAVQANLLAAMSNHQQAINQVYNVTMGEQTTLNQLFEKIASYLDSKQKPIYREYRNGDIRHSLADISRAQRCLGYIPQLNVSKGLENTINWLKTKI